MKYKTPKQYKQECINMGLDLPVDSYIDSKTKIKHKCRKCNKMYEQNPNNHLQGKGCPICNGNKKKTTKEYIDECKRLGYDLPIEPYVNNKTKINHKCNKCGYIYKQKPDNHLHNNGCPNCRGKFKKTPQEYYNECKQRGLDMPIENYINALTKIKHRCDKGHVYKQQPSSHLNGNGCPKCFGKSKKTTQEYINKCKQLGIDLPIEEYVKSNTKIKHKCSNGHIYEQKPNNHLNGNGCPKCGGVYRKNTQDYINECKELGIDLPIESYVNNSTKIKHKCNKCGKIYKQTPSNHLQGQGCPKCSESHGEKFISNYLDKHNIHYIPQKKFNDLKDKRLLSYDFCLPEQKVLVEYQGEQHFKSVSFSNKSKSDIQTQQYHDKLKREYAKDNGYKLLELHHSLDTQDKVNKYLDRNIK